jgi:hypothetical protein
MNRFIRSVSTLALLVAATAVPGKDLIGVYEDALKQDPQLQAANANRLASRESRPQGPKLATMPAVMRISSR